MSSVVPPLDLLGRLVDRLIVGDYEGAADLSRFDRLPPAQIRWAIDTYGRTLVPIPPEGWNLIDIVAIRPSAGGGWSVRLPLWTAEEGRSDLEVQATIRIDGDGHEMLSLDDILVP
jgi:hypothetical protein